MAIQAKTIKPNTDRQVYTQKMWIKTEIKKPIRADELFLVFAVFFVGVMVMAIMYFNQEKTAEKQRIETMKQAIEQTKRY
jgi:uncharacterized membrane protein YvbJ